MRRRRTRRRKRTGRGRKAKLLWTGFCVSALLVILVIAPSTAYNVAEFDRQSGADVVADDTALVGLQKASSIEEGQETRMVTVGNNFSQTDIEVTVELTPPSRSEGNLVINGNKTNATQFTIQPGEQQDINACFTDDGDGVPDEATFNATFNGLNTAVSGSIGQRNVSIVDNKSESNDC
jgi:hypothetical protein